MHSNPTETIKTNTKIKKLKIVLILISTYLVVEVITGFYTGSLSLLADAGHMFTDTFGIGIDLIASIYSKREAASIHTFGFFRTEISNVTMTNHDGRLYKFGNKSIPIINRQFFVEYVFPDEGEHRIILQIYKNDTPFEVSSFNVTIPYSRQIISSASIFFKFIQ